MPAASRVSCVGAGQGPAPRGAKVCARCPGVALGTAPRERATGGWGGAPRPESLSKSRSESRTVPGSASSPAPRLSPSPSPARATPGAPLLASVLFGAGACTRGEAGARQGRGSCGAGRAGTGVARSHKVCGARVTGARSGPGARSKRPQVTERWLAGARRGAQVRSPWAALCTRDGQTGRERESRVAAGWGWGSRRRNGEQ